MASLKLFTRARAGMFEGDALLLVYGDSQFSEDSLVRDIKDVFETSPHVSSIHVLVPFVADGVVREEIQKSQAVARAATHLAPTGSAVNLLTLQTSCNDDSLELREERFSVGRDNRVSSTSHSVDKSLINGWLFSLFDRGKGLVVAPVGVHFKKTSSKHTNRFLRVANVLVDSTRCGVIAFFAIAKARNFTPRRIFVDTGALLPVALSMDRIAKVRGLWASPAGHVSSFGSYGGLETLPTLASTDMALISATTSGDLIQKLVLRGIDASSVRILFHLESMEGEQTLDESRVDAVCDLTFRRGRSYGYGGVKNFSADSCPYCKQDWILAELQGDQFTLEQPALKRLRITNRSQKRSARTFVDEVAKQHVFGVRAAGEEGAFYETVVDLNVLLKSSSRIRDGFDRLLRRFSPIPVGLVVLEGISQSLFQEAIKRCGLADVFKGATIVSGTQMADLQVSPGGAALVLFGVLENPAIARSINARLRTLVPRGAISYLSVLTLVESAQDRRDLEAFLRWGENGPDTFTYRSVENFQIPRRSGRSSWEVELEFLRRLIDRGVDDPRLKERVKVLSISPLLPEDAVFWEGQHGRTVINNDFVYLDTTSGRASISQADVYAVMSNLLACSRNGDQEIAARAEESDTEVRWRQSLLGNVLLCPKNFQNYNDAILRSALLRAASDSELRYISDSGCSAEIRDLILADIEAWPKGEGDSLPEFCLAIGSGRLRLVDSDHKALLRAIQASTVPDILKIMLAAQPSTY